MTDEDYVHNLSTLSLTALFFDDDHNGLPNLKGAVENQLAFRFTKFAKTCRERSERYGDPSF